MATKLAMRIAVEMEVHAALGTTTTAKAEAIDAILEEIAAHMDNLASETPVDDEARAYWDAASVIRAGT